MLPQDKIKKINYVSIQTDSKLLYFWVIEQVLSTFYPKVKLNAAVQL